MKKLPIGTRVFDVTKGWGTVFEWGEGFEIMRDGISVKFDIGIISYYTKEGLDRPGETTPILSLTEYSIQKEEFTPVTEFDKPKIGDVGYFWDSEDRDVLLLSKLTVITDKYKPNKASCGFDNFSKEIPQWFLDRMNK